MPAISYQMFMETLLKFFIGAFTGGLVGGLLGLVIDFALSLIKDHGEIRWIKLVPYTQLVKETILYTNDILVGKKIKHFPSYRIRYYRHKKYSGVFDGTVTVYLGSNPGIPELVDTVLHEVQHYVQSQTDRQYKYYDRYTAENGYWNNPFEVECRAFAARHRDACLRYLETKNLIKKV